MLNEKYRLIHRNPVVSIESGNLTVTLSDSQELRQEVYSDAGHVCVKVTARNGAYEVYRTIETYETIRKAIKSEAYCAVGMELVYQSWMNNQTQLSNFGVTA